MARDGLAVHQHVLMGPVVVVPHKASLCTWVKPIRRPGAPGRSLAPLTSWCLHQRFAELLVKEDARSTMMQGYVHFASHVFHDIQNIACLGALQQHGFDCMFDLARVGTAQRRFRRRFRPPLAKSCAQLVIPVSLPTWDEHAISRWRRKRHELHQISRLSIMSYFVVNCIIAMLLSVKANELCNRIILVLRRGTACAPKQRIDLPLRRE